MDIAKYIGLFLLKNKFCYLHGLGNLELKKKPATYDGDALHAPEYDIFLTPGGSIDDTLANYIATHEQTSISKAANALREFSTATRAELAVGKEVEIPAIGKFTEENGVVKFIANPHLQHAPPPIPMLRMSKRLEETPDFRRDSVDQNFGNDSSGIAWGKIALIGLLLVVVIAGIIFGIRYFNSSDTVSKTDTAVSEQPVKQTAPVAAPLPENGYTVVINTYSSRTAADKRAAKLTTNGNKVEVVSRDSVSHLVTMHVATLPADTTRMMDSLRRLFNPKGVYILK